MASYQAPGRSLVALLCSQLGALPPDTLSLEAVLCLKSYARHLQSKRLDRDGDHLLAGLLLNALEIAAYIPTGKIGKGGLELTRLQERIERVMAAERSLERRAGRKKPGGGRGIWLGPRMKPPTRQAEAPEFSGGGGVGNGQDKAHSRQGSPRERNDDQV